jgi:Tfp pilus assembly protein PilO
MDKLPNTIVEQASRATPGSEVVYSLILLLLLGIALVFYLMYRNERKANHAWAEKSLRATELLATVHLRLEDQLKSQGKVLEFTSKLDSLIEHVSDIKELKGLLETIRQSLQDEK